MQTRRRRMIYTRQQAATVLECSIRTVDKYLAEGRLGSELVGGRRLITREHIIDFAPAVYTDQTLDALDDLIDE